MQKIDGVVVFSPTDLNHFLECEYLTRLEIEVAEGRVLATRRSPEADLLATKGEAHEHFQLAQFERDGRQITRIADPATSSGWTSAAGATIEAMHAGADIIYQGALLCDGWRGKADFLVRVNIPSALGEWSYEAWDAKLARHAKPSHILQLAFYSERLSELQERDSERMWIVLGSGERVRLRVRDFSSYFRVVRGRFLRAVRERADVAPYPVAHCDFCGYLDHCVEHWEGVDHLSLVAGIRRSQAQRLADAGIVTCVGLAPHVGVADGVGPIAPEPLRHQASLQTHFRRTGTHRYDLLPPGEEN